MAYHHTNSGTLYKQGGAGSTRNANMYNSLRTVLDPHSETRHALLGFSRPGLANATFQNGRTVEEMYSNILHRAQNNDQDALKFIHDNRMEQLMGAFAAGRDQFPRPYPSRYAQPHYAKDNPGVSKYQKS